jgi:hypothetical protein
VTYDRRTFLKLAAGGAVGTAAAGSAWYLKPRAHAAYLKWTRPTVGSPIADPPGTEVLYNGIKLPTPWPPYREQLDRTVEVPPYLQQPPAVVPIDVGRQLFVDDFLIEECELDRSYHSASYIAANPILTPVTAWDVRDDFAGRVREPPRPTAMPFSDGVWFDPSDRRFKLWYTAGYGSATCYAESADGVAWHRPPLDVIPGTNIVLKEDRDSSTVWLDLDEPNPHLRFKMTVFVQNLRNLRRFVSADGIHWVPAGYGGPSGDRSTCFYNPFRKVWVYSLREHPKQQRYIGRHRRYVESRDFCAMASWTNAEAVGWVAADDLDRPRVENNYAPELYNLDCVAYESVLLGLFTMFFGDPEGRHKPNHIGVGFSRDGFHWARPSRGAFIGVSDRPGDWNWTNVQSAGGCCLVIGDRLYFYVSGRAGVPGSGSAGVCTTGLATLRRDGFVSLDAPADRGASRGAQTLRPRSVTTRPLRFTGSNLFVNVDAEGGELRAEVLDTEGKVIEPFTASRCAPVHVDSTRVEMGWPGASLASVAGQPVRFRFYLRGGRLYSFWVAPDDRGASRGYVAAGGPGFGSAKDDAGA